MKKHNGCLKLRVGANLRRKISLSAQIFDEITDSHKASTVDTLAVMIEPLADACSSTMDVCMP